MKQQRGKKKKSRRKKKVRGKGTNKQQPNKKDNKKNSKKDKIKECAMEDIHAMNRKEKEKKNGIMCCRIKGGIKVCIHKMIEEIKKN